MTKNVKNSIIIMAIGLVVMIVAGLLTSTVMEPRITQQDFDFTVTYTLDGETKTLNGTYQCRYDGHGWGIGTDSRFYNGDFLGNDSIIHPSGYTIAEDGDLDLCIVLIFSDHRLMGDATFQDVHNDPYLAVYDEEGYEYSDEEHLGRFNAEIVGWEFPESVDNSFAFKGFSCMSEISMLAMVLVGLLLIVACMIFVRRDKTVNYKVLDYISIVLNVLVVFLAIPIMAILIAFMSIVTSGEEIGYQILLCLPAFTALTVAASTVLRRLRYTLVGFLVPLAGPVLFVLYLVLEAIIYAFV